MKKTSIILLASLLLCGCDKFLERTSQNLIVPTTVAHYKEMLQGWPGEYRSGQDGYFQCVQRNINWVNHMTDDISFFDISHELGGNQFVEGSGLSTYRFVYQWADNIEENFADGNFGYFYSQVQLANTVLADIDRIEDTTGERELLRGQALFHRAFAYFYLANFYAQAYNESTPDSPCVPLKLNPTPSTEKFTRATMAQVWGQIRSDLDAAIASMEPFQVPNIYEIDWRAAAFLAMRVSLFMEDYDSAIAYGEKLLALGGRLFDITGKEEASSSTETASGGADIKNFISKDNPEIIWLYGAEYRVGTMGGNSSNTAYYYAYSDELINSYSEDLKAGEKDHRQCYFFIQPEKVVAVSSAFYNHTLLKYDPNDLDYRRIYAFRTGEVYLTLAEAWARKGSSDKALEYLNALRRNRISGYSDRSEADAPELLQLIWRERRREMVGEECHRWWDLRRTGQPRIEHKWEMDDFKTKVHYVLEDHDPAYVLNFPASEREQNPDNFNERPYRTYIKD